MDQVKVVHRFWAGRDMPMAYIEYGQQWRELNPDWVVMDWHEGVQQYYPELSSVFESLYERDAGRLGIELYVQLADVIGYALVQRHGGVYVNCDMQPVRPLGDMPSKAWASYENDTDGRIVNAAFGAPQAEDPFWTDLLQGLPERYFQNPTAEMIDTTGPGYLTDFAACRRDELHVFPTATFNPIHWKQIDPGGDAAKFMDYLPADTIAVHHWGHKKDGRSNTVETATQ